MKRTMSRISICLFALSLILYIVMLLGNDAYLLISVVLAVFGLIAGAFSEKGLYKRIGLIGNGALVVVTLVIPITVTTFFWNTP
ncbi:hypothetical protein QRD89_15295 [Halobacillus sp. ACCC02827]|uniref:hypothetical protein n=1 Tax=Halobacillus sp. ACCC02827 TaxID=3052090 RepID=UPI0025712D05|nr:hypothetical protein [Halobacillus sp. ACCC02827]WJE15070.1 hypothetical protein QRD89_15295 [Halobacillus sp. ACCC02827]